MRNLVLPCCLLLSFVLNAQKGITFDVEQLTPPERLLEENHDTNIYKRLLQPDATGSIPVMAKQVNSLTDLVARYKASGTLVNFGYHSFFDGIYHAYAEHRPVVLSPDMIWLLISQGFAHHVNNNAEALRKHFVKHDGRVSLIVKDNRIRLNDPESPWQDVFPAFTQQIEKHTGKALINALTADFTTTTPITRIASQITIMDAMKKYFEYIIVRIGCGIPQVTLQGTTADWEKVLEKARSLKKYELDWWLSGVEPLLQEFVNASKGNINRDFWRNMFKYHDVKGIYKSKTIDGWFVKFFPYNKEGKRNNLDSLSGSAGLPDEIVKVDLRYLVLGDDGSIIQDTPLELWAGFIGLRQNKTNYALTPEIGWLIKRKDTLPDPAIVNRLKREKDDAFGGIEIRVNEVPREILQIDRFKKLTIIFIDSIRIPQAMGNIQVEQLILKGKISQQEEQRIFNLFPQTNVFINSKTRNDQD
ncbi:DUF4419 domain-containing protein [Niabella yanshanensis]|uniref:DUF4419 domain-containing protein n=1 Tax=Niabella yanshanensis TaxID=577386 RepID=A0ABZ0W2K1_9BACT|nr:DUF4419 domain-containing protein [Niabella yanshanensis]WQD36326.1 DUF4419 domain-containing protein [Niabella yanshanensis]